MLRNNFRLAGAVALAAVTALSSVGRADSFTFTKLVDSATPVPGGLGNFTAVNVAAVDADAMAFVGTYVSGAQTYTGLYRFDLNTNSIQPIADINSPAPGGGGGFQSIVANGDFNSGNIVFASNTSIGQSLYRYNAGTVTRVIANGDTLPGAPAPVGNFLARGVSGDATDVAFNAHFTDNTDGLYVTSSGFPFLSADNKTRAPGPELGNFVDFPEIHYKDGRTVFIGRTLDADNPDAGIEPGGIFSASPGNPVLPVVVRNQPIPGAEVQDFHFNEFEKPHIDKYGRVGFVGGFEEDDPSLPPERYMGVWAINPDRTMKVYADSSMTFPDQQADIFEFWGFTFDGAVPIVGMEDELGGSYIYMAKDFGGFEKLIDTNDILDGKSIARVRFAQDGINDGLLVVRVNFTDGSSGLYSVQVPEPASIGAIGAVGLLSLSRRRSRARR